jgi:hypothetical protein
VVSFQYAGEGLYAAVQLGELKEELFVSLVDLLESSIYRKWKERMTK